MRNLPRLLPQNKYEIGALSNLRFSSRRVDRVQFSTTATPNTNRKNRQDRERPLQRQPGLLALPEYRPEPIATIETIDKHPLLGVTVKFELDPTEIQANAVKRSTNSTGFTVRATGNPLPDC